MIVNIEQQLETNKMETTVFENIWSETFKVLIIHWIDSALYPFGD
jgi:hypothetical protein